MSFFNSFFTCFMLCFAGVTVNVAMTALKDPIWQPLGSLWRAGILICFSNLFFIQRPPQRDCCPTWSLQKVLDLLASDEFVKRAGPCDLLLKALSPHFSFWLVVIAVICLDLSFGMDGFLDDRSKVSLAPNPKFLAKNEREAYLLAPIVLQAWVVEGAPSTLLCGGLASLCGSDLGMLLNVVFLCGQNMVHHV